MSLQDLLKKQLVNFSTNSNDDLEELDLSNIKPVDCLTPSDKECIEKFEGISSFCMNQAGLRSLENWPKLNSVYLLNLSGNKLRTGLKEIANNMPHIAELELEYNRFEDISEFQALQSLSNLISITLQGNPIAKLPNYRQELFNLLPNVKMIDNYDRNEHDYMQDLIDNEGDDIRMDGEMMKMADEMHKEDIRNESHVLMNIDDTISCI